MQGTMRAIAQVGVLWVTFLLKTGAEVASEGRSGSAAGEHLKNLLGPEFHWWNVIASPARTPQKGSKSSGVALYLTPVLKSEAHCEPGGVAGQE